MRGHTMNFVGHKKMWLNATITISSLVVFLGMLAFVPKDSHAKQPPLQKSQTAGRHFALIIGDNDGGAALAPLQFAQQDAKRVARLLYELGGYQKHEIKLLLSPNLKQIRATMKQIKRSFAGSQKEGSFLFYYSGHAKPAHFQIGNELLAFKTVVHFVRSLPVKLRFVIVDSCYSGSIVNVKGGVKSKGGRWNASIHWGNKEKKKKSSHAPKKKRFPSKLRGFAILASSGATDRSFESKRLQSSFFTSSLLSGLRGGADKNHDRRISLSELREYVYQQTLAHSTRHRTPFQRPASSIMIQGGQYVYLTYLKRAESQISFEKKLKGHVFLFREGKLVHEFTKMGRQKVTVAIRAGNYQIQIRHRGWLGVLEQHVTAKQRYDIPYRKIAWKQVSLRAQARGSVDDQLTLGFGLIGDYLPFEHLSNHGIGLTFQIDLPRWFQLGLRYRFSATNERHFPYQVHNVGFQLAAGYGLGIRSFSSWIGLLVEPHLNIRALTKRSETLANFGLSFGIKTNLDYYVTPHWAMRFNLAVGGDLIFFEPSVAIRPFFDLGLGLLFRL